MNKIKNLVNIIAVISGMAFFDGMLDFGISEGVYTLLGFVLVIVVIWLVVLVNKK